MNTFEKTFDTQFPQKSLKKRNEDFYSAYRHRLTSKSNHPGDRGLIGALPIRKIVNTLVYLDLVDPPRCKTYDSALMIVDALNLFCQVVPFQKTMDGEGVLKAILRQLIHFFQPMVKIHSDRDIRFTGEQGWYLNAFRALRVEVSFGQPYQPQSNGSCEHMNEEYQEALRILRTSIKTSNGVQLNDYAMVLINNK